MNLALIVAAGKGTRMGAEGGKQFLPLAGKPVLAHALIAFQMASLVDAIIVVVGEDNHDRCLDVVARYNITKVDRVVLGGAERQDSVYNGLHAAAEFGAVAIVAVHDGARPLITPALIDATVRAASGFDGAVVGIPAKDTIKLVQDGIVQTTLERSATWQIQTPQVFRFESLLRAHEAARAQGFYGTDDAMLVERAGGRVRVVPGSDENIKVTTPTDLVLAEALLAQRTAYP